MKIKNSRPNINDYIRALRLPFLTVSILPFIAGSLINKSGFLWLRFVFGLLCVAFTHLGANLINDYADSKSGADWKDRNFYEFFGGSKLIQEGILTVGFYRTVALFCFCLACICVIALRILIKDAAIIGYFLFIAAFGFFYSHRPFQFCYRRLGEVVLFILFGPAIVMGAYYIQTHIFPSLLSFMLSLPFGIFTAAILFANEVPDYEVDVASKKFTLVSVAGKENAFVLFYGFIALGFCAIAVNIAIGYLSFISCIAFLAAFSGVKAAEILRNRDRDKVELKESSQLVIITHTVVSITIILDLLL